MKFPAAVTRLVLLLDVLAGKEALAQTASEEVLKAAVVRIEVSKIVERMTPAGVPKREPETYVASGFWAPGTNRIVTCAHVVEGATQLSVYPYRGTDAWSARQVTLCYFNANQDLAVLQVPETRTGLALASSPGQATDLIAIGNVENFPWRVTYGRASGIQPARQLNIHLEGDVLVCDVTTGPGASGGIVVDRANHVLGMIEGGKASGVTRVAVPSTTIERVLQTLPATCRGSATPGGVVHANEETYADLQLIPTPDKTLAHFWGEASYGFLDGIDRFGDAVPAVNLDAFRTQNDALTWVLDFAWAHRALKRSLQGGTLDDEAKMDRIALLAGPRLRITDFGRVSIFSSARAGYVHDRVQHDYTFKSNLFAPQSVERPVSGVLGTGGVDVELFVVLNLRVAWSGEVWQGSGGIGNGVTQRIGLRLGVGHAKP